MPSEEIQAVIQMLRDSAAESGNAERTVAEWRQSYEELAAFLPALDVAVVPVDAGGVPAEWIGDDSDGPVVMYVHGGGYCLGSTATHRSMLTHLASAMGGRVLSLDYRLAPENPFPAALDDASTAYRWLLGTGVDSGNVLIGGDSAGGGLTIAALLALREGGDPLPAGGICLSPWADLTQSGATMEAKADIDPMVRAADLDRWAGAYAGSADPAVPSISPIFADLSGLPPLHVEVGTAEVLLDDARRLVNRAQAAGVSAELVEADDMIHVWPFFAGLVPEADVAIERIAGFVRDRCAKR